MWIMLWLLASTSGAVTAGVIDFPTKEVCQAAQIEFGKMVLALADRRQPTMLDMPEVRCIQRATGKP